MADRGVTEDPRLGLLAVSNVVYEEADGCGYEVSDGKRKGSDERHHMEYYLKVRTIRNLEYGSVECILFDFGEVGWGNGGPLQRGAATLQENRLTACGITTFPFSPWPSGMLIVESGDSWTSR